MAAESVSVGDDLRLRRFLLYGSEQPMCKSDVILNIVKDKLSKTDCPTLVKIIDSEYGALRALNTLKSIVTESVPFHKGGSGYNKAAACFALVLLIKSPQQPIRGEAYRCLPLVCPTSEDLFLFHFYFCKIKNELAAEKKSGEESASPPKIRKASASNGMKRAIQRWYNAQDPLELAKDTAGMTTRYGQSHSMIVKSYHPKGDTKATTLILAYLGRYHHAQRGSKMNVEKFCEDLEKENGKLDEQAQQVLSYLRKLGQLHHINKRMPGRFTDAIRKTWIVGEEAKEAAAILSEIDVPILHGVPTSLWKSPLVFKVLIPRMTIRQILDNLPRLSDGGFVLASSPSEHKVDLMQILSDKERLKQEGIQPFEIIAALRRFEVGHYRELKLSFPIDPKKPREEKQKIRRCATESWPVCPEVVATCCQIYGTVLELVPRLAKSVLIGVDVSPTIKELPVTGGLVGMNASDVLAVMISVLKKQCGDECKVVGFSRTDSPDKAEETFELKLDFPVIDVKTGDTPPQIMDKLDPILSGPIDIAALLNDCVKKNLRFDAVVILAGDISTPGPPMTKPQDALRAYRKAMGVEAKMVVVGAAAKMFTISDVEDPKSLDCLGFGLSNPKQIHDFLVAD